MEEAANSEIDIIYYIAAFKTRKQGHSMIQQ